MHLDPVFHPKTADDFQLQNRCRGCEESSSSPVFNLVTTSRILVTHTHNVFFRLLSIHVFISLVVATAKIRQSLGQALEPIAMLA
ncbi:hypothetical protein PHLCEN_2v9446 [Hermanssonia centrifuga]|uniref:Uncharacterized protein n=1 Tax=Hermanssonia centrifuga TaxID=98765 RepID=A0A2R6NQN8_9APHY|nr:hypothetical protein PHLCEN_2v9446 [Hermanssonia centrifuga]